MYYNVTLRRIPLTVVAAEKLLTYYIYFIYILCLYPYLSIMKAHAPYYIVVYALSASIVFLHFIP